MKNVMYSVTVNDKANSDSLKDFSNVSDAVEFFVKTVKDVQSKYLNYTYGDNDRAKWFQIELKKIVDDNHEVFKENDFSNEDIEKLQAIGYFPNGIEDYILSSKYEGEYF